MSLDITGKIIHFLEEVSGSSSKGPWKKKEFVVETLEQYPKKVCMSVWGDEKVSALNNFKLNDVVKVSVNAESREYNGRWYTDLRAWRIDSATDAPSSNNTGGTYSGGGSNPVNNNESNNFQQNNQQVNNQDLISDESDDLPF